MQWFEHIRNWYRFPAVIGLSADLDLDLGIQMVHVKRTGSGLSIIESKTFEGIDMLKEHLAAVEQIPVSLLLNGKAVLLKEIQFAPDENTTNLIQQVFPIYNEQEFYSSLLHGVDRSWVAIIHREQLDKLILMLQEKGINLLEICIGPFVFDNILQQLNVYNHHYTFAGHGILTDPEGRWLSYDYNETNQAKFSMKIGITTIKQEFLGAYAMAFHTLMDNYVTPFALEQVDLERQKDESLQRLKFRNNGILLLATLFVLLVFSVVLFTNYQDENQFLARQVGERLSSGEEVEVRVTQTAHFETQLKELGWNGGISKAWLLDQLGVSLNKEKGIDLTAIQINPPLYRKRDPKQQTVVDLRNVMLLSGRCISLEGLNAWARSLSQLGWVEHLRIVKFGKSEVYADESFVFQLELMFGYAY